jgi:glycosyltransferase involved in cell wall biosynthesis
MAATYEQRKGHAILLEAFASVRQSVPAAHLIICGQGTEAEVGRVQRRIAELNLDDSVHLIGYRKDIRSLLQQANLLVIPSQSDESCSMIGIEALSCGIPIVATNIGGMTEVVSHGEVGYCVNPADSVMMAHYMISILSNPQLASELGYRANTRFQQMFTSERMASRYAGLIAARWASPQSVEIHGNASRDG